MGLTDGYLRTDAQSAGRTRTDGLLVVFTATGGGGTPAFVYGSGLVTTIAGLVGLEALADAGTNTSTAFLDSAFASDAGTVSSTASHAGAVSLADTTGTSSVASFLVDWSYTGALPNDLPGQSHEQPARLALPTSRYAVRLDAGGFSTATLGQTRSRIVLAVGHTNFKLDTNGSTTVRLR